MTAGDLAGAKIISEERGAKPERVRAVALEAGHGSDCAHTIPPLAPRCRRRVQASRVAYRSVIAAGGSPEQASISAARVLATSLKAVSEGMTFQDARTRERQMAATQMQSLFRGRKVRIEIQKKKDAEKKPKRKRKGRR